MSLLIFLAGCAPTVHYDDVRITQATLQDADTNSFVVIGGPVGGDALLVFSGPGVSGTMPVALRGGAVGVATEINVDLNPGSDVRLDLSEAGGAVWLSEVLGAYRGLGWSLTPGVGGDGQILVNAAGVRLEDAHFSAGIGVFAGFEWIRIRAGGHEDSYDDELEWVWSEAQADTADTGIDTGAAMDTGRPASRPQVSTGCRGSSDPPTDDEGTDTSSSDEQDTDASSRTDEPDAGDGASCEGSCSGGGCDTCSGSLMAVLFVGLAGLRRRVRREPSISGRPGSGTR